MAITDISAANFVAHAHALHWDGGMSSYVDVARLLLELNTIVKTMAKGNMQHFHTQERSLYVPLKDVLDAQLPAPDFVNVENVLHKTTASSQKTDLSLRNISQLRKARLAKDMECTHFVEIKSVFHGEALTRAAIEDDLVKLLACEAAYQSVGFFALVGLHNDLQRNKTALQILGALGQNNDPFTVKTHQGTTVWLRPAGSYLADEPFVYVWEVSASNIFTKERRSGCSFSLFQKRIT
ncbi:hypothetical protein GE543_14415 [Pseudomonas sp. SZ57]|uniref:hypothetical protein n=1 Tax=Pseudomonas sp. SZ57 TaxID=2662259 RepID=UPI001292581A|nr:hypothetical protein [Pseudomonas sp. SZ57]MQQ35491.1 hypothetical protein [Pseudomonas sp. SZ57]